MLVDRTSTYDTKLKLQKQLDYLYGANLYYKVTGYGKGHVLEIKSQVLNERYTNQSLLKEQFELLYEVLEKPLLNVIEDYGIEMETKSGFEMYKSGVYNDYIRTAFENVERIKKYLEVNGAK